MQVEISVTITKTYGVNVADDIDFDADDIADTLLDAIENTEAMDSHIGSIEVVNHLGNLIYNDSEG